MRVAINGIAATLIMGCLAAMEEAEKVTRNAAKEMGEWRTVVNDKPITAESVERCLESKVGESLEAVREAMREQAKAFRPEDPEQNAFQLYEKFRPAIPEGMTGWGTEGRLDI
jgi:hypothetical protein